MGLGKYFEIYSSYYAIFLHDMITISKSFLYNFTKYT